MMAGGSRMTSRRWRRIRTLLLLADGLSARATAEPARHAPREARRVGHRYREGGLDAALGEDPRPLPPKLLDSTQEAAVSGLKPWREKNVVRPGSQRGTRRRSAFTSCRQFEHALAQIRIGNPATATGVWLTHGSSLLLALSAQSS